MPMPTLKEQLTQQLATAKAQLQDLDRQQADFLATTAKAKAQLQAHVDQMQAMINAPEAAPQPAPGQP
jgi:hypothetical protein